MRKCTKTDAECSMFLTRQGVTILTSTYSDITREQSVSQWTFYCWEAAGKLKQRNKKDKYYLLELTFDNESLLQ